MTIFDRVSLSIPELPSMSSAMMAGGKPRRGKLTGGRWVTIHGHPAYIKGGQVVAGGVHGHTHDDAGKPSGVVVPLDKADSRLARAHVVRGMKAQAAADRIRRNAPGKDEPHFQPVDHGAMASIIKAEAARKAELGHPMDYRYSHGRPRDGADREHLRQAEDAGASAIKVTTTPKIRTEGRRGERYYAGWDPVARIEKHPDKKGHRVLEFGRAYEGSKLVGSHDARTLKGAHKIARKLALASAREQGSIHRLISYNNHDSQIRPYLNGVLGDTTRVRAIHRAPGEPVGFSGSPGSRGVRALAERIASSFREHRAMGQVRR